MERLRSLREDSISAMFISYLFSTSFIILSAAYPSESATCYIMYNGNSMKAMLLMHITLFHKRVIANP